MQAIGSKQKRLSTGDTSLLLVRAYGHVVIDECHHVPAVQVERVLAAIPARYITGLTATPYRRDGHQPIITMQCGPVRHSISSPTAASITSGPGDSCPIPLPAFELGNYQPARLHRTEWICSDPDRVRAPALAGEN